MDVENLQQTCTDSRRKGTPTMLLRFSHLRLKQLKERTNRIMRFIESRSDLITEYNDTLVRYFVEKILVYEDRLSVELKIGDNVEVEL